MKKTIGVFSLLVMINTHSSGLKSLEGLEGADFDLNSKITSAVQLSFENPFEIQTYSIWKASGVTDPKVDEIFSLFFNKKYGEVLKQLNTLNDEKLNSLKNGVELYSLYKLNLMQIFTVRWIEISSRTSFLKSELGIAFDQTYGDDFSSKILNLGIVLDQDQKLKLKTIETHESQINFSLQAYNALKTGESTIVWIGKLKPQDPLRIELAKSLVLFYAKENKLGASGKVIKSIIEPYLAKSNNVDDISSYFLMLARLLYQAGAYGEAKKYFSLIPQSSKDFYVARSELLWAALMEKDYSLSKGEYATLGLDLFDHHFMPESYLVSAMNNVLLCQFTETKKAIDKFVSANKKWASVISSNLNSENPSYAYQNFTSQNLDNVQNSLDSEKHILKEHHLDYGVIVQSLLSEKVLQEKEEKMRQWKNRSKLLETAIYKMNFLKVEFISRMRNVQMKMKLSQSDDVSIRQAATARKNQISFPEDGVLWGDDLFRMSAEVKNLCVTNKL